MGGSPSRPWSLPCWRSTSASSTRRRPRCWSRGFTGSFTYSARSWCSRVSKWRMAATAHGI